MQNNSLLTLFTKLIKQEVDISNYTISKQTTNLQGSVFNAPMQIPNTVVGDGPSITTPASGYFGDFEVVDQGSTYLVSIQGGLYNGVDWTAKEFVLEKYTELGYFENTRIFYIYVDTLSKTLILKESSEINDSESTHFVLMMIVLPPNPTNIIYTYDTDPETSKFIYGYEANFLYYLLMYSVNIPSVLPEIPAGKITGNLVIEGNATITSQSESVLLTPDGMYIYDVANVMSLGMDGDYTQSLLATFNKNGLFFYDGTGTVLSKFTKDEASIAGWIINADSLSGTNIILYPEGGIQTIDFEEGIVGEVGNEEGWSQGVGWKIAASGSAYFNNVTVFGTLYSSMGNIAGWEITDDYIANGNIVLASKGEIYTANYIPEVSGWKIRYDGLAEFNNAVIRSTLYSDTGFLGNWKIANGVISSHTSTSETLTSSGLGVLTLTADAVELIYVRNIETGQLYRQDQLTFIPPRTIEGMEASKEHVIHYITAYDGIELNSNGTIQANYEAETSGWKIDSSGDAEFNSILIRNGDFQTGNLGGDWEVTEDGKLQNGTDIVLDATNKSIYLNDKSTYASVTNGVFMGYDSGTPKVNIGNETNYFKWTGSDLVISGEIVAPSGVIGGWTIGSTSLSSYGITLYASEEGEETPYIGLGTIEYSGAGIWLGKDTSWKASFFKDANNYLLWDGSKLTAKAANFELDSDGKITVTGGTIGGWSLDATTISAENIILDSAGSIETSDFSEGTFVASDYEETKSSTGEGTLALTYKAQSIIYVKVSGESVEYTFVPQTNSLTNLAPSTSHTIKYVRDTGVAGTGWKIESDGDAFFNDVTVFGTLYGTGGNIGGWDIGEGYIANGNIVLASSGEIYTANYNHRISGWKIRYDGFAEFNDVLVRGEIESSIGNIGGWLITGTTIESEGLAGIIMSSDGSIASKNFVIDTSGWKIFGDGTAEFADVIVRSGSLGTTGELDGWSIGDGKLYNSTDIVLDANSKQIYLNNKSSYASATAGVFIGYDTDAYKVSIGTDTAYLKWDGTDLTISGEISATAGDIGGWDIDATTISSSSLTLTSGENPYIGIGTTTYGSAGIWLGKDTFWKASFYADASNYLLWDGTKLTIKAANFTLDSDGKLTATSADITGAIKATSGYIGGTDAGWQIDTGVLKNSTAVVLDATNKQIYFNNKNAYASDTAGIFMGYDTDAYKVNIGDAASYIKWDGTDLTISGELTASTGAIGGWTIDTDSIYSGNVYIRSDESRFEINVDESVKLAMGYLDGIGDFTATDFGIYVGAADAIYIEADEDDSVIQHISGDWLVKDDANILIKSGENTVLRIGKANDTRGLFLYDASANVLASYTSSGVTINVAGTNMKIGNAVESTNNGIYIGATNYWYSDGSFKIGSATSYITGASDGIVIESTNFKVSKTGVLTATDGAIGGWTISSTSIYKGTDIFINSATPYIGVGTSTHGSAGIWLGKHSGAWKASFFKDANNYLLWDGSKLTAKAANFELNSAGKIIASSVDLSGKITATDGAIGGWTIGSTTLTAGNITLDSAGSIKGNYTEGSAGWSIKSTGEAEFNTVTIRSGSFENGTIGGATGWTVTTGLLKDSTEAIVLDAANKKVSVGTHVALGSAVVTDGYAGLKITANNYWETNGSYTKFSVGSGKFSYDDSTGEPVVSVEGEIKATSGYIGNSTTGWKIGSTEMYAGTSTSVYSLLLDSNNTKIGIHRPADISYPAVSLGMSVLTDKHGLAFYDNTDGSSNNYWVWDTNEVKFRVGTTTSYLDFNVGTADKLKIVTDTFSLSTTNLTIDSATEKIAMGSIVLQGGTSPYIGIGTTSYSGAGIWLGKDSTTWKASFYANTNNYLKWTGSALDINVNGGVFRVTTAGALTATSATITGNITATSGTIAGWIIDGGVLKNGTDIVLDATAKQITISGGAMKLGIDVNSTNDGLYINDTNYWYSGGSFKIGSGTSYITGSSSGIVVESTNFTVDNSGTIMAKDGTVGGWTLAATALSSNDITISSTTSPYIGLGITAYGANNGIWLGKSTSWKMSIKNSDGSKYFIWDGSNLSLDAGNMSIDTDGDITASNVDLTGKITASSGAIGKWTLASTGELYYGTSINVYSIMLDAANTNIGLHKLSTRDEPSVKIGYNVYDGMHGIVFYESGTTGLDPYNYWVWKATTTSTSGKFRVGTASNYIDFAGSSLSIATDTFNLSSTNFKLVSGTYPYLGVNAQKFMGTGVFVGKGAKETITPNMGANVVMSAGDGTYVASDSSSSSVAFYAFKDEAATYKSLEVGAWVKIQLPVRKIVYSYNLYAPSSLYYIKGWELQGSNDDDTWITLDSQSEHDSWTGTLASDIEIANPAPYLYYRLKITEVNEPTYLYARVAMIYLYDEEGYKLSAVGNGTDPNYISFNSANEDGGLTIKADVFSLSTAGLTIGAMAPETEGYLSDGIFMGYRSEGVIYTYMTSNILPAGQRAFDENDSSTAYYVFDSSTSTYKDYYPTEWVTLELPRRKTAIKYRLYTSSVYFPTAWKIQGSIEGITWTDLDTRSGIDPADGWSSYYTITSPNAYKYYRFYVTTAGGSIGGYARLYSIDFSDEPSYNCLSIGSVSTGNSFIWDGNAMAIKGDLYVGAGDSGIYFEDSKIFLGDNLVEGIYNHYIRYVANLPVIDYPNIIFSSVGFEVDSDTAPTTFTANRSLQNRFYNYSNPTYFAEYLTQNKYTAFYNFYTSSSINIDSYLTVGPLTVSDDDSMYIYTPMPAKFMIPEWYGTTTAIAKYPDISAWTDPEYCPISNIWVWRKSSGTPSRVLYVKLPDGNVWWVSMTEL